MYYKILMEHGHMGAGKSLDVVRYIEADNVEILFDELKSWPGLKAKESGRPVSMVKPISRQEFEVGKVLEFKRKYIGGL